MVVEPVLEPEPMLPDELVPPLELEPDLPKCASHSAREIWPSLFVSTDEKLGVVSLELELGELELELPPAAPVDELPLEDDDGEVADGEADEPLEDLPLSAATASPDRTKSAAAVVTVTVLSIASLL